MMTAAATPSLARIPAGEFLMGAADAAGDERPVHRVYVEEFFIGRFPVTNEDYARFVRATGHPAPAVRTLPRIGAAEREELFKELSAPYEWDGGNPPHGREGHPVVLVRYDDCASYCRWLSDELGRAVRMPTDAEWEKAARGGLEGRRYPWGDEIDASRCNYLADGGKKTNSSTKPAGTYPPNGYGLFEMAGNVWEWVTDWYDPGYRAADGARDPQGPPVGSMRLVRGGSWVCENVDMLRCAYRHRVPDDTYAPSIGFRIVCPR
jgi:formylglycine-generating enzyme required for sulfatase activity